MAEVQEAVRKPLPGLPRRITERTSVADDAFVEMPTSPTRPRLGATQSYRQKRKIPVNGKTVVISLPLTDRESSGLPSVLSAKEVQAKLDALIVDGWDIHGFDLTTSRRGHVRSNSGQSRPAFPESEELQPERKIRQFTVHFPNQREWEDWVNYLQEEKLRALGVSPSSSEVPPSVTSPFSQPLSRNSSKYTGPMQSPPMGTSSAASNPLRATNNPFSPTISGSPGFASQIGYGASSQYNGFVGSMHAHKPLAPMTQAPGASPINHSATPPQVFGQRPNGFPPAGALGIQSLGEVLSPSTGLQVQESPMQSNLPIHLERPQMPPQPRSLPRTPIELKQPTPRSHRHNLSATLQKEIDEAEAALEKQEHPSPILERREADMRFHEDGKGEDEIHDELPILKRPETIDDDTSDIITNPSMAPSPLLEEKQNPFANWQALSDAARASQQPSLKSHKSQPSVSRFNVQAREFDPTSGFKSSNFFFTSNAFQPIAKPSQLPTPLVRNNTAPAPRHISASRLNVEAPTFVPGGESKSTPEATPFKYSCATFNVTAPEFEPHSNPSENFKPVASAPESERPASTSIFGSVEIDPDMKVSRRTSKALPVTRPRSKDGPSSRSSRESSIASLEAEGSEDKEGRVTAPAERTKRARRGGSDSERSPTFANSAPFRHTRILSEIVSASETQSEPDEKPVDGWAYVPADEAQITHEKTPQSPLQDHAKELPGRGSPFEFRDQVDVAKYSEAVPRSRSPSERSEDEVVEVFEELSDMSSSPIPSREPHFERKERGSPLAIAEPSAFDHAHPDHPQPELRSRMSSGLAASRWADTSNSSASPPPAATIRLRSSVSQPEPSAESSSPISCPGPSARLSSSPVQPEPVMSDETDEEDLRRSVRVTEELSDDAENAALSSSSEQEEARVKQDALSDAFRKSPQFHHDDVPATGVEQDQVSEFDDDMQPSFEEIDAVMKQFEDNPDLGIERNDSPVGSKPLVNMRLAPNFRSDAPSPSPRRNAPREMSNDAASAAASGRGLGTLRPDAGKEQVSDWNDTISTTEEDKVPPRAQFFDGHVSELVDGILESRLEPLERTLQTIQHSLSLMTTRPSRKSRRSTSTGRKDSDADDEDDYDASEGFSTYRSRSPEAKKNRRTSRIRVAVAEGMASYRESMPQPPPVDLSAIMTELAEMRQLVEQVPAQVPAIAPAIAQQKDMKAALEEVISNHPRLRGSRVKQDFDAGDGKAKLQIDGLEAILKHEQERADHEILRRRKADEEIELLKRALENAEAQAAEHKESAEQAEQRLVAFVEEKAAYRGLEQECGELNLKNDSLEKTLEEYRQFKDELQDDLEEERQKSKGFARTLFELKDQLADRTQRCHALHDKVERLQEQMSSAVTELASEQADWRSREHELETKMSIIENALNQATRQAETFQLDMDDIVKQHKEGIMYKDRFENLQTENSKAQDLIALLKKESRTNEDKAYSLERELGEWQSVKDAEAAATVARLTAELEGVKTQLGTHKTDSESHIARLQSRLDTADQDLDDQKIKHDTLQAETHDAHSNTIRELNEKREQALEEQRAAHERKLGDLRDRHTRAMHNSSDDRHRMEHQFNDKLGLSEDKVKHLEGKVTDLEERLEITKSAARAAVEAATAKGVSSNDLPTPANSVVTSPPTRAVSASLSIVRGEPEKIPVQSLRESIMVLQEQVQDREQKIESLEAEIRTLDKEAPAKIKNREIEVQWLRELLAVRVDDIEDLIATLGQPDFEHDSVRAAAIRIKANIQMEQQIRERSSSGLPLTSALPSLSQVTAYAQSPRQALPLVATAAWGNFRKARQYAGEMGGTIYEQYVGQTPSKSNATSPASFLSNIMTPPNTQPVLSRRNSNDNMAPPPTMRPLAAAAAARKSHGGGNEPRPLRGYSSQPRALGSKINTSAITSNASASRRSPSPHTPTMSRGREIDLSEDFDDDASMLGRVEPRADETAA